ncbi:DUF4062 domain-containing protein [Kitasatospora xanthocidica]|uniref:DUF4062 domain-containing protein n=1 Tax=Kitasatospora xanthocidica TaxID=83382 RepID=A0A372ZP94_9ACTN|nr:DUF4062 domain-containing protein [Kitasatospora xanthocidica]RGD57220.1 DUF4062 domain-containing protein [Kitasatospora xanthocidica]
MPGSRFRRRRPQDPGEPERPAEHVEVRGGGVGAGADVAGNAIGPRSSVTNNFNYYGPAESDAHPGAPASSGTAPPAGTAPDERRYQVFVSSTSLDLKQYREAVIDELVKEGYIPSGMELFDARAEGAWEVVERVINDCDYLVLILGARYGDVGAGTVSFTEREYDHARSLDKPILVFVHADPVELHTDSWQPTPEDAQRLAVFREKVRRERLWRSWRTVADLRNDVTRALRLAVRHTPQPGWVKGNSIAHTFSAEWQNLVAPGTQIGVARISVDGQAGNALSENLGKASSIGIMSTSGKRLIEIQTPYLTKALAAGSRIRVLVPTPDGQFLVDVDESESLWDQRSPIAAEVREVEARLRSIVREAGARSTAAGSIEIGFFTTHLRSTMILCDRTWGWVTLTLPPARAPETPSLELRGTRDFGLIDACWKHFDRTWAIVEERGEVRTIS